MRTSPLNTAEEYFVLSNNSDFEGINRLFTDTTTYSSQNTGVFLGAEDVLNMQREFHGSYSNLNWKINSIAETKPGVVLIDYDFTGTKKSGEKISSSGLEYVVVKNEKIQHVEIRNK